MKYFLYFNNNSFCICIQFGIKLSNMLMSQISQVITNFAIYIHEKRDNKKEKIKSYNEK